jgi:hypothetical protein
MSSFETKLSESDFVRIHRTVIVNRKRIKELRPWFTGEYVVILNTGKELTLSRGYRDRSGDIAIGYRCCSLPRRDQRVSSSQKVKFMPGS